MQHIREQFSEFSVFRIPKEGWSRLPPSNPICQCLGLVLSAFVRGEADPAHLPAVAVVG